ncbi:hypothetical protein [Nocardia pneumoniae]|uniref:hypothetical protein n=1 Tax=Nocardia pneumoniae TaxID=228601 RepID=UPI0012F6A407|nr:hypothetical protein [Nocardia pneumoniae]
MSEKTTAKKARESGTEADASVAETEAQPSATRSETATTEHDGLRVPIPTLGVRMTKVPLLPGPRTVASGVSSATTAVLHRVPDRESLLYYGGLGTAAATGLVSWPVATAIGLGVWVAEHARREVPASHEASPGREAPASR